MAFGAIAIAFLLSLLVEEANSSCLAPKPNFRMNMRFYARMDCRDPLDIP